MGRFGVLAITVAAISTATMAAGPRTADSPERAADPLDRMICKRFIETGSLVRGYRACKTKREWDQERDYLRTPRFASGSCNSGESGNCEGITEGASRPVIY